MASAALADVKADDAIQADATQIDMARIACVFQKAKGKQKESKASAENKTRAAEKGKD